MRLSEPTRWVKVAHKHYALKALNYTKRESERKDPLFGWVLTLECPYRDTKFPLSELRKAVDRGEYFMAQRRTGPFAFDLVVTRPRSESYANLKARQAQSV
jgi:hypothetical protein